MLTETRLNAHIAINSHDGFQSFIGNVHRQLSTVIRMVMRDEDLSRCSLRRFRVLFQSEDRTKADVDEKNTFTGWTTLKSEGTTGFIRVDSSGPFSNAQADQIVRWRTWRRLRDKRNVSVV